MTEKRSYSGEIMNIRVFTGQMDGAVWRCRANDSLYARECLYKEGHRDARHKASELVLELEAERDDLLTVVQECVNYLEGPGGRKYDW